jgi:DNA-binding transcriptional ArsR family regulator
MAEQRETDIANVAAAIGDASRARVLLALADGRALPASALAAEAGVGNSTISAHLARLREAKLLTVERDGRHHYYRLASMDVAVALEHLAGIARPLPVRSLREDTRARALLRARLCYDHLAGRLGVELMTALVDRGLLATTGAGDVRYHVTERGAAELTAFGVDLAGLAGRRAVIRYCVDWGEHRHHLAGGLGAALTARLFDRDWLRHGRIRRAVRLTEDGAAGLRDTFGLPDGWDAA